MIVYNPLSQCKEYLGGLSPGLLFMLRTVGKNSSPDVYKEAVLQTLAEIREERKAADKKD